MAASRYLFFMCCIQIKNAVPHALCVLSGKCKSPWMGHGCWQIFIFLCVALAYRLKKISAGRHGHSRTFTFTVIYVQFSLLDYKSIYSSAQLLHSFLHRQKRHMRPMAVQRERCHRGQKVKWRYMCQKCNICRLFCPEWSTHILFWWTITKESVVVGHFRRWSEHSEVAASTIFVKTKIESGACIKTGARPCVEFWSCHSCECNKAVHTYSYYLHKY